jgi:hypothetical protein
VHYQAKIVCDPLVKTKGESYRLQDAKARNRRLAKSVTILWTDCRPQANFPQPKCMCCRFRSVRAAVLDQRSHLDTEFLWSTCQHFLSLTSIIRAIAA